MLFNDTIRYNIAYGRIGASEAEIEEAARMAQIDRFIRELPLGYESMVGERGPEAFGRRKAARRHRPHHPEEPADPAARRGDLRARHPHRARDPERAEGSLEEPHRACDRASAFHGRRRRRDPGARSWRDRRARPPRASSWPWAAITRRCGTSRRKPPRRAKVCRPSNPIPRSARMRRTAATAAE